jgi:hypothetical protein
LLALPPDPDDTIAWYDFRALRKLAAKRRRKGKPS